MQVTCPMLLMLHIQSRLSLLNYKFGGATFNLNPDGLNHFISGGFLVPTGVCDQAGSLTEYNTAVLSPESIKPDLLIWDSP